MKVMESLTICMPEGICADDNDQRRTFMLKECTDQIGMVTHDDKINIRTNS